MKLLMIITLIVSCGQDYNSNSFDDAIYGNQQIDTSNPEGQRFAAAFGVIENKCISCHSAEYSPLNSTAKWLDTPWITKNDFDNSFIIRRLKNYGGDMPQGASELSTSEINVLREWIENIP